VVLPVEIYDEERLLGFERAAQSAGSESGGTFSRRRWAAGPLSWSGGSPGGVFCGFFEAERNLAEKRPEALAELARKMAAVRHVPDPTEVSGKRPRLRRRKKRRCPGDLRHFGKNLVPRVEAPREFLSSL